MKNNNSSFSSRRFKNGAYTSVVTVIVLVLVVAVNILASKFNIKHDITATGLYTLTDETKTLLGGLNDDINMYYLSNEGGQDETIYKMVSCFADASSHVNLLMRDPNLYPNFIYEYVEKGTNVYKDSVIVENVSTGKSRLVSSSDFAVTETDYQTYQSTLVGYDVEGKIASAIQYVTSTESPKIYFTSGHGEISSDSLTTAKEYLKKLNIDAGMINIIAENKVPEDCDALVVMGAQNDFTADETEVIKDYLTAGGNIIIYYDYSKNELTNIKSILEEYGITPVQGIVLEQDADHEYRGVPDYICPDVISSDLTSSSIGKFIVAVDATGLDISSEVRSSVTRTAFLTTSDSAFSKVDVTTGSYSKSDEDIAGPFAVGAIAEENYNDVKTRVVAYGTSNLVMEEVMKYSAYGNSALFTDTLNYVVDRKEPVITVPTKSVAEENLAVPGKDALFLGLLFMVGIPVAVIACGAIVCIKRRRR